MAPSAPPRNGAHDPPVAIRVLWLSKGLGPGGAERLIALSARHRDRSRVAGYAAYLLPHKHALVPEIEAEGVPVTCLNAPSSWDPRWLVRLRRLLRCSPVDVVHVHSPLVAVGTRLVVRTLPGTARPKVVTTFHNMWQARVPLIRVADRLTARWDDAEVAVSEAVRLSMPTAIERRAETLLHGVDIDDARAGLADRAEVRKALGWDDHELVVITVANLRAPKAHPDLMSAARTVLDHRSDIRFAIIGQGPLEAELHALHRQLELGDRVQMLGYRADAVRVMAACDMYCLASHFEGLPLALLEALALGLPVVATRVGGVPEAVTDGVEAVLVPAARPDLLAEAIEQLADDAARRSTMAGRSAERGRSLSVTRAVGRNEEIYREVVSK